MRKDSHFYFNFLHIGTIIDTTDIIKQPFYHYDTENHSS